MDLIDRQAVQEIVDRIGDIHPYRQIGNRESYSQYNEAWTDAINRVDAELNSLPSAQPNLQPTCNKLATDTISRQAAIDAIHSAIYPFFCGAEDGDALSDDEKLVLSVNKAVCTAIKALPSAQPEVIRCKDCIYYVPPHVENNGVRYEYDEMPADAFDALGTGLVNAEYGINIGGRCCVDYYCKNYSDDKRVFVREDNYCGRAERRTDD